MAPTLVYVPEDRPEPLPSIFLAGPTPRPIEETEGPYYSYEMVHRQWREDAVTLLETLGFNGNVFLPVNRPGVAWDWEANFETQVEWELFNLKRATCIVFWVPRSNLLPGFTTNIEFGMFHSWSSVVLGYPKGAKHMRYMTYLASQYKIPVCHTLRETLEAAIHCVSGTRA